MEKISLMYLGIALAMAGQTWAIIWSRRETLHRVVSVIFLVLWMPVLAGIAYASLGWHKPMWAAVGLHGKQRVLAAKMVEGEAIYLYVDVGAGEPRAFKLPWSTRTAEQLQEALRESRRRGRRGAIMKFDHSWNQHPPEFWPMPQPQLPLPKSTPPAPPRYERGA